VAGRPRTARHGGAPRHRQQLRLGGGAPAGADRLEDRVAIVGEHRAAVGELLAVERHLVRVRVGDRVRVGTRARAGIRPLSATSTPTACSYSLLAEGEWQPTAQWLVASMNSPSGAVSEADIFCVPKRQRISSPKSRKPEPTTTTSVPPSRGPCAGESELTKGVGGAGKQKSPAHIVPSPWSTAISAAPAWSLRVRRAMAVASAALRMAHDVWARCEPTCTSCLPRNCCAAVAAG
jgi:hypothetical protein